VLCQCDIIFTAHEVVFAMCLYRHMITSLSCCL